ncbi:MAG TPA: hypothetical protein VFX76_06615 [Roseiflexaceae bacterium]|nr:hypothetical protein [Roseiflexaceae bacterium]
MHNATTYTQPRAVVRTLDPRPLLRNAWKANRPLTLLGLAMIATFVVSLAGLALDSRVITGAPAWLKPMKFAISISIYSFTLVWMLGLVQGWPRLKRVISLVITVAMFGEMVGIVIQVLRGVPSHFNASTLFDAKLFDIMGSMIMVVWVMTLLVMILLLRQRLPDRALAWSLRLGLLITLVGMASGFLMTSPTPSQQAELRAGHNVAMIGAHSVGVPDDGPGMPITGWSTTGGDLRIGHFAGLHALQALPLVGWLLGRRRARRLGNGHRVALVLVAGLAYLGLTVLLLWQALRGQPLLAPDATTLLALGGLLGITTISGAGIIAHGKKYNTAS